MTGLHLFLCEDILRQISDDHSGGSPPQGRKNWQKVEANVGQKMIQLLIVWAQFSENMIN